MDKNHEEAAHWVASFFSNIFNSFSYGFLATELSDKINGYLSEMPYMREPKGLYAPIEYVLSLGGKRIRPVLMLLAYNMYKEDVDCIFAAGGRYRDLS